MENELFNEEEDLVVSSQDAGMSEDVSDEEIGFEDLGLDEITLAAIEKKGFVTPSPIQVLAIPRLLNGDANVIAKARTGTGKTAAFGLPLVQTLRKETGNVRAIILEPTRELAMQTSAEMASFSSGIYPRTCVVYGGASITDQMRSLRKGCEIVVGTPGRVQDLIDRNVLDISKIEYFILDEGDEMLDMGFVEDIEKIFSSANPECRVLLFSATIPSEILKIAQKFMGDYEIVEEEGVVDEPLLIDQKFWVVRESDKIEALVRMIDYADDFYGIVFTQTKNDADHVTKALDEKGYDVAALHGDIAQAQREKIITRFRSKKTKILVATDVAARGIDINGLTYVVNFSLPFDGATYVHRIGRTGRAGSKGVAVTFVAPQDTRKLGYLRRAVAKASKGEMKEEEIPAVEAVIARKKKRLFSELKQKLGLAVEDVAESENQENMAADNSEIEESVQSVSETLKKAAPESTLISVAEQFTAMADELCQNNEAKDVLAAVLSVLYNDKLDKSRYGKIQSHGKMADQVRLYIQVGRRDGYNPKGIADYFSKMLHIPGRMVDRIDISSNFSLVSLPKDAARKALELAKKNQNVPHMHVDVKEGGFGDDDFGVKRGGRGGHGGRSRGHGDGGFGRSNSGRGFGGGRERDRKERGSFDKKHGRPNVHTPTERTPRTGSAGLYKQKKSGKAERF